MDSPPTLTSASSQPLGSRTTVSTVPCLPPISFSISALACWKPG